MGKEEVTLARLCVEWHALKEELEAVEAEIEEAILDREETYAVPGVVRATYYSPSLRFDYEVGVERSDLSQSDKDVVIQAHTKTRQSVSWAKVVSDLGIPKEEIPSEEKPAHVNVKVE